MQTRGFGNRWYLMRAAAACRTPQDLDEFEAAAQACGIGRDFLEEPIWANVRAGVAGELGMDEWAERARTVLDLEAAEHLMIAAVPTRSGREFLLSPGWLDRVADLLRAEQTVPA